MVLYKKLFPLGKGVSFSDYINAIKKKNFPSYVLTLDKIPSTENYHAQIFFVAPLWRWGLANAFLDGVILNKCTIQHFKDAENFTLQASAKGVNLFLASIYILLAILPLGFAVFMIATNDSMSLNNTFGFGIVIIFMLALPISIYLRDKKLLDKVGSLARELEKK